MYIPRAFRVSALKSLHHFIGVYGFATLVSNTDNGPLATHLPLMIDPVAGERGTLFGHMARANPHWRYFETHSAPSLAVFHGPHAYISPAWYVSQPAVPTWNFAAVHVYGQPEPIVEEARVTRLLDDLVRVYESRRPKPWKNELPADFRASMQRAIVAFEFPIERIEGKFKLNQNRSLEDQKSALQGLSEEGGAEDLSTFWRAVLSTQDGGA